VTSSASLSDYGVRIEAESQRERCYAFDHNGDRCPYARESSSLYCSDSSPEDALLTLEDLNADRPGDRVSPYYHGGSIRDILRDQYGFSPREAVVLASGSALSTCYVIEGRLSWAAHEGTDTFRVSGHDFTVERGRELLELVRDSDPSGTFAEKWSDACRYVSTGKTRCSYPRESSVACGFHADPDEDLLRVDRQIEPGTWGPGDSHGGEQR